jgi:predicted ester cyclase
MAVLFGEFAEIKNLQDVGGMLCRTNPACVHQEVGVERVATGLTDLREYHTQPFAAPPDHTSTVENIAGVADAAVAWGWFPGMLAQPHFGDGQPGDPVDIAAEFVCQFRDGLLHRERPDVDLMSLRRKLPGPTDRAVAS